MRNRFQAVIFIALAGVLPACATGPAAPQGVPGAPAAANQNAMGYSASDVPTAATIGAANAIAAGLDSSSRLEKKREAETKVALGSITIDCAVKLPDDPTDNPELCRSFQMELVDETGEEAGRFRFGIDARYRFPAKVGKRYRVRPLIGKNWEFSIEPDRELTVGERARVQLRQKQ